MTGRTEGMTENLEIILIVTEGWTEINRKAKTLRLVDFIHFAAKLIQD